MSAVTAERLRNGVAAATPPGTYLSLFLLIMLLWRVLEFPSPTRVYAIIVRLFQEYGLFIVFIAALIEGLVLVSLYFPGSAVILLGVATNRGEPMWAASVVVCVTLAFILSSFANFAAGYFGLHGIIQRLGGEAWLVRARRRYARHGVIILAPSFIHPNLGGFMSVAAGIARLSWPRFMLIATLSISVWNALWGLVAYVFAETVQTVATRPALVVAGLASWTVLAFVWGAVGLIPGKSSSQ